MLSDNARLYSKKSPVAEQHTLVLYERVNMLPLRALLCAYACLISFFYYFLRQVNAHTKCTGTQGMKQEFNVYDRLEGRKM